MIPISNKCYYFDYEAAQLYQHIINMSEECDTEDWSNDAETSALHHRNKLHFKIENSYLKL